MSEISENLKTIAANEPRVYSAGANDFGMKKTVKGTSPLVLKNVHPKEHDITVKVDKPVNLLPQGALRLVVTYDEGANLVMYEHIPLNGEDFSNKYFTLSFEVAELNLNTSKGQLNYGIGYNPGDGGAILSDTLTTINLSELTIGQKFEKTYYVDDWPTSPCGLTFKGIDLDILEDYVVLDNLQLEFGEVATEYVPYLNIESLTVSNGIDTSNFNENGVAKVKSISPETTLTLSDDNIEFSSSYFTDGLEDVLKFDENNSLAGPTNNTNDGYDTAIGYQNVTVPFEQEHDITDLSINNNITVEVTDTDITFEVREINDKGTTQARQSFDLYYDNVNIDDLEIFIDHSSCYGDYVDGDYSYEVQDDGKLKITITSPEQMDVKNNDYFFYDVPYVVRSKYAYSEPSYFSFRYWSKQKGDYIYVNEKVEVFPFIYSIDTSDIDIDTQTLKHLIDINYLIPDGDIVKFAPQVFGYANVAGGLGATAVGYRNESLEHSTFTAGYHNKTLGDAGATFGSNNINQSSSSLVAGATNIVGRKAGAIVLGSGNTWEGGYGTVIIGLDNKVLIDEANSAQGAVCLGRMNTVYPQASGSVVAGIKNRISGLASFVAGTENEARKPYDFVSGIGCIANQQCQRVYGQYNEIDINNKYVDIVGWGNNDSLRKNIYTLEKNTGNGWFRGTLIAEGNSVGAIDNSENGYILTTRNYVKNKFPLKTEVEKSISAAVANLPDKKYVDDAVANVKFDTSITDALDIRLDVVEEKILGTAEVIEVTHKDYRESNTVYIPENVSEYAEITSIYGGHNRIATNYLPNNNWAGFGGATEAKRNGLTFTLDYYGRIIVNSDGPITADFDFYLYYSSAGFIPDTTADLKGSGCPAGGSQNTYAIRYMKLYNNGQQTPFWDYGSGTTVISMADKDELKALTVMIQFKAGTVCDNLIFAPCLTYVEDYEYLQRTTGNPWCCYNPSIDGVQTSRIIFDSISEIRSYDKDGVLIDTWVVPEEFYQYNFNVGISYSMNMWPNWEEYAGKYGHNNSIDLVNKRYYNPIFYHNSAEQPAFDMVDADGVIAVKGNFEYTYTDISHINFDNKIKVAPGGKVVSVPKDDYDLYADACRFFLSYNKDTRGTFQVADPETKYHVVNRNYVDNALKDIDLSNYVTKEYLDEKLTQIENVVDRILEIQNSLIGGKQ